MALATTEWRRERRAKQREYQTRRLIEDRDEGWWKQFVLQRSKLDESHDYLVRQRLQSLEYDLRELCRYARSFKAMPSADDADPTEWVLENRETNQQAAKMYALCREWWRLRNRYWQLTRSKG